MSQVRNLQFREGSYPKQILLTLALTGEIDYKQIVLMHDHFTPVTDYSKRIIVRAIDTMKREANSAKDKEPRDSKNFPDDHKQYYGPYIRLKSLTKDKNRPLLLQKRGKAALRGLYPEWWEHYLEVTENETTVNAGEIQTRRSMRLAELYQWIMQSPLNIKFLRSEKPDIVYDKTPYEMKEDDYFFYSSREVKKAVGNESLKIDFTRFYGVIVSKEKVLVLFHAGKGTFTWRAQGEQKTQVVMKRLFWNKFNIAKLAPSQKESISEALIFGRDYFNQQVSRLVNSTAKKKSKADAIQDLEFEFFSIGNVYRHVSYAPTTEPVIGHLAMVLMLRPQLYKQLNAILSANHPSFKADATTNIPPGLIGDFYSPSNRQIGFNLLDGSISKIKIARTLAYSRPNEEYVFFCTASQKEMVKKLFEAYPSIRYSTQVIDEYQVWHKIIAKWLEVN